MAPPRTLADARVWASVAKKDRLILTIAMDEEDVEDEDENENGEALIVSKGRRGKAESTFLDETSPSQEDLLAILPNPKHAADVDWARVRAVEQEMEGSGYWSLIRDTNIEESKNKPFWRMWRTTCGMGSTPLEILSPRRYLTYGDSEVTVAEGQVPHPLWKPKFCDAFTKLVVGSPCEGNLGLLSWFIRYTVACRVDGRRVPMDDHHTEPDRFLDIFARAVKAENEKCSLSDIHASARAAWISHGRDVPWQSDVMELIDKIEWSDKGKETSGQATMPYRVYTEDLVHLIEAFDAVEGIKGIRRYRPVAEKAAVATYKSTRHGVPQDMGALNALRWASLLADECWAQQQNTPTAQPDIIHLDDILPEMSAPAKAARKQDVRNLLVDLSKATDSGELAEIARAWSDRVGEGGSAAQVSGGQEGHTQGGQASGEHARGRRARAQLGEQPRTRAETQVQEQSAVNEHVNKTVMGPTTHRAFGQDEQASNPTIESVQQKAKARAKAKAELIPVGAPPAGSVAEQAPKPTIESVQQKAKPRAKAKAELTPVGAPPAGSAAAEKASWIPPSAAKEPLVFGEVSTLRPAAAVARGTAAGLKRISLPAEVSASVLQTLVAEGPASPVAPNVEEPPPARPATPVSRVAKPLPQVAGINPKAAQKSSRSMGEKSTSRLKPKANLSQKGSKEAKGRRPPPPVRADSLERLCVYEAAPQAIEVKAQPDETDKFKGPKGFKPKKTRAFKSRGDVTDHGSLDSIMQASTFPRSTAVGTLLDDQGTLSSFEDFLAEQSGDARVDWLYADGEQAE